eukprot:GGOE01005059.1.p1 GENE.GGOE01005059.1~~GGOE01005059.1.p1  ORF type:complete len:123 (-),score=7.16 GGOE01005059.1:28-396(-)
MAPYHKILLLVWTKSCLGLHSACQSGSPSRMLRHWLFPGTCQVPLTLLSARFPFPVASSQAFRQAEACTAIKDSHPSDSLFPPLPIAIRLSPERCAAEISFDPTACGLWVVLLRMICSRFAM